MRYLPGYKDPAYDGTEAGFRDIVLPARIEALCEAANARLDELGHPEIRIVWDGLAEGVPGPVATAVAIPAPGSNGV